MFKVIFYSGACTAFFMQFHFLFLTFTCTLPITNYYY